MLEESSDVQHRQSTATRLLDADAEEKKNKFLAHFFRHFKQIEENCNKTRQTPWKTLCKEKKRNTSTVSLSSVVAFVFKKNNTNLMLTQ